MLDRDQVRHVARLARLELTPDEEERFTSQLVGILGYVEQLSELDTASVQPTTRAIDERNITRSDTLHPWPAPETLLDCAPDREEGYFKVPKILAE
ncbi:Asp-tRNA(Asn)/Glu-tRNA(Gln) amidotransferase subunit GatC [Leptolyngbya sp. FACHB-261]|uniref:Asp-tRNA(Asn)/Glu-tRNA(Gln) amidotransferase subunit GatC n=1 Tax=Leptolyngbya sp. FACHB-261 TaxID=2692806 RepID=UPI001688AC34|nr:Asp-tRNA(Asn)/Glu-tRNA(Gln) amidotransferase subunit GatC [Leptolyngbya sp. FACHB-261]MBD2104884.1 Asp-tRNA(Asn)/Glu-tRNA(Gln) amidotransferase subunit GatC [Leptolyngbya sp. FACHB-261]